MDVFVGRQPIFDRIMNVYGYELLYRRSERNFFEGLSHSQATAVVINNAFLSMHFDDLTCGTKAFINFSGELLEREVPLLLPKERIVVEIIELTDPTPAVLAACKKLVREGYVLALDDFVCQPHLDPLLELVSIIKIETTSLSRALQQKCLLRYQGKKLFVAEKLDSREDFDLALKLGFDLFQGYFFSKPRVIIGTEVASLPANLITAITELERSEPDFAALSEAFKRDLGLMYKLLRMANSVVFGAQYRIESLEQAFMRIGTVELKKWAYLMLLMGSQHVQNRELVKTCLVRGRLMEGIARDRRTRTNNFMYFLTGILSAIDVILGRPMPGIFAELPLPGEVADALEGRRNTLRLLLDEVMAFERADWPSVERLQRRVEMPPGRLMDLYLSAVQWANQIA